MAISKTEINLRRLIAAAPQQNSQAKLIHYVSTMRELLDQLATETTPEGLPRVSKTKVSDYSEKIESIASKLAVPLDEPQVQEAFAETHIEESPQKFEERSHVSSSAAGLRKRVVQLQEDLTDEMVGLARQLKESSLMMSRSVQNTEKILDSTEKAVEVSLASTGHATSRATQVYSQSSKTSCLTWLAMFVMMCVFIMVVLLIRVT
ncbi:hypothetical protein V2J09_008836 [Rumex salicifolius]